MDVKSAKSALTSSMFLLTSNSRNFCCLVVMVHIAFGKRISCDYQKNHLHFRRNLSANLNRAHPKLCQKGKNHSIFGTVMSTPHWLIELTKKPFSGSFYTRSVCCKATWFSQSATTVLSALLSWNRIQFYSDCKISRPQKDDKFPKNSSGSLELDVVPETRLLESSSSEKSDYIQPVRYYGHAGCINFKCRRARHGPKRV